VRDFLKKTGPLVAPSANIEGEKSAKNIDEARKYFGDSVDFYEDGGEIEGTASTLVKLEEGKLIIKRQGSVKIDDALLSF